LSFFGKSQGEQEWAVRGTCVFQLMICVADMYIPHSQRDETRRDETWFNRLDHLHVMHANTLRDTHHRSWDVAPCACVPSSTLCWHASSLCWPTPRAGTLQGRLHPSSSIAQSLHKCPLPSDQSYPETSSRVPQPAEFPSSLRWAGAGSLHVSAMERHNLNRILHTQTYLE
jgi:hypothetical protein